MNHEHHAQRHQSSARRALPDEAAGLVRDPACGMIVDPTETEGQRFFEPSNFAFEMV